MEHSGNIAPTVQIVLYGIIGMMSLLSNSMIFIVIGCTPKLRTVTYLFLLNLAVTDCLIIIIGVPVQLANLVRNGHPVTNGVGCELHGWLILMTFLSSNFNLVIIAVYRYALVVKNNVYQQIFRTFHIVIANVCVWLLSLAIGFPPLFGWGRYSYNHDRAHCMVDWINNKTYVIFLQLVAYPIPLVVMCYCYFKIFKESHTSRKRLKSAMSVDENKMYRKRAREYRLSKMLLLVLVCFFALFLPYAIVVSMEGYFHRPPPHAFSFVAMLMAYSNSMCDFWIYAVMSMKFRKALKSIFNRTNIIKKLRTRTGGQTITTTITSTVAGGGNCGVREMDDGIYKRKSSAQMQYDNNRKTSIFAKYEVNSARETFKKEISGYRLNPSFE